MSSQGFVSVFPVVSVIIPSYNHENYIKECIKSVIDQDYENIELIIIDDGSKDGSVEQINALAAVCEERFLRFEFRSRENVGLCKTLNEAIEWCQGDFLYVVASDDVVMKHKTSTLVSHLERDVELPAVFGSVLLVDREGKHTGKRIKLRERYCSFSDIFLLKATLPAVGSMVRVNALKEVGGFDPATKVEDFDMWLRLTVTGRSIKTIAETVALYRKHDSNFSSQTSVMHEQIIKILEKYEGHRLYKKGLRRVKCLMFRDYARIDKSMAVKLLPSVIFMIWDFRLYQGILIMLSGRRW